ncbi:MAG: sulfate adenylyltransferase [Patescibacteria group bacterium]
MIEPHGNILVNRVFKKEDADKAKTKIKDLVQIELNEELVKDVKNIARGVYSPLKGFMGKADFESVLNNMTLANGIVWPIPFVLDVDKDIKEKLSVGDQVGLVDENKNEIALMNILDVYEYDKDEFSQKVFGTKDKEHPGVQMVHDKKDFLVGGGIELIDNSKEPFEEFNLDPDETRTLFQERGWKTICGFQTRNTPHKAHEYLQRCGLEICDGLFINPVIGKKKSGDFKDEVILESYLELIKKFFPKERIVMSILPLAMQYAGPKEAVLHAIIRKNFGCSHFIVGRDHAGVGDYYSTFEAQEIFDNIPDLGMNILKFEHSFYCKKCKQMATAKTCPHDREDQVGPSGTIIRDMLSKKELVPEDIMRPEISEAIIKLDNIFVE